MFIDHLQEPFFGILAMAAAILVDQDNLMDGLVG